MYFTRVAHISKAPCLLSAITSAQLLPVFSYIRENTPCALTYNEYLLFRTSPLHLFFYAGNLQGLYLVKQIVVGLAAYWSMAQWVCSYV